MYQIVLPAGGPPQEFLSAISLIAEREENKVTGRMPHKAVYSIM